MRLWSYFCNLAFFCWPVINALHFRFRFCFKYCSLVTVEWSLDLLFQFYVQFSVGIPSSMSKFDIKIGKCDGAVVIGDRANLTIGATQGKVCHHKHFVLHRVCLIQYGLASRSNVPPWRKGFMENLRCKSNMGKPFKCYLEEGGLSVRHALPNRM